MSSVSGFSTVIEITPTITASSAYTANNQLGGIQTISNAAIAENRVITLVTLAIVDKAKQNAAMSIFFFDRLPTVASTDKTAMSMTAAEMLKCVGCITVAATDYQDTGTASVATKTVSGVGLCFRNQNPQSQNFVVVKTTGTPTYASTSDLVFKYVFGKDF